ncbi:unnamed protein product [Closterium sp. Naga37s-1]|nr:unnamed protein product [Closterium sp. Naga37s-1]
MAGLAEGVACDDDAGMDSSDDELDGLEEARTGLDMLLRSLAPGVLAPRPPTAKPALDERVHRGHPPVSSSPDSIRSEPAAPAAVSDTVASPGDGRGDQPPPPPLPWGWRGEGGEAWRSKGRQEGICSTRSPTLLLPPPAAGTAVGGEGICHPPAAVAAVGGGDLQHQPPPLLSALFSSPSPCCGCSSGGEGICRPPGADAAVGGGDLQHLLRPAALYGFGELTQALAT